MAGKPSVLGRATSISDYIKYGMNKGVIEIELNNQNGANFVIKRVIFKDNRSEWFLNDRQAKLKEIEDLVASLNIQVGNLCQFLPQEKVAEFARLNMYELLESTEKAVGGVQLYEQHLELKDNCKFTKDLERDLATVEENLKREETINARLENQVKSFLEKRKFEEKILWLKRKRACLLYQEKKKEFERVKKEKEKIVREIEALSEQFEPLERKKSEAEKKIQKQKNIISSKSNLIQENLKSQRSLFAKLDDLAEKVNDIKNEYVNKEHEIKQKKASLTELRRTIEVLRTEYEEARDDLAEITKREEKIRADDAGLRQEIEKMSTREYERRQEYSKLKSEYENVTRKLNEMKNVREEKLNKLRQRAPDAYQAIDWLSKNRGRFKGQVYEPMFLLMNIKMQQAAKYVENSIAFRDLTSLFLFEKSDDMHDFMSEVRDRMSLVVHTALIPNQPLRNFKPPRELEEIKKFGFYSFIRETIDAPEAILVYLCLYSFIHGVPIGTDATQKNISTILPHIGDFSRIYTSTHQYAFSRSRYTKQVSSSSAEVPNSFWLTSSINQTQLGELEEREVEIRSKMKELDAELKSIQEAKQSIESQFDVSRGEMTKLRERRYHIENLGKKLQLKAHALKKLELEKHDLFAEAQKKAEQLNEITKRKAKLFAEFSEMASNLMNLGKDKVLSVYQEAQFSCEKRQMESESRVYSQKKQELEGQIEQVDVLVRRAKEEAMFAIETASKVNQVNLEKGVPESYKQMFAKLPDTIDKLESEVHQCEAISQCSYDVDEKVVEEYQKRKKEIERLQMDFDKRKTQLDSHQKNYESLKNEWLEKVEEMVKSINEKFSRLFGQLNCLGEICLARPDAPDDFAKYGICIKVSFRQDEKLQELTAWKQSGGEKSVATMMYMIGLQEMTRCPFRVVDEINQGMDPVNERKVFDIIVQNSCSKQFAQYFLLTPKLLADLAFDAKTKVICVNNGRRVNSNISKHKLKEFIQKRS